MRGGFMQCQIGPYPIPAKAVKSLPVHSGLSVWTGPDCLVSALVQALDQLGWTGPTLALNRFGLTVQPPLCRLIKH